MRFYSVRDPLEASCSKPHNKINKKHETNRGLTSKQWLQVTLDKDTWQT